MIALLAAIASPAFIRIMRDIGLSRLTMQLAELYRRGYVESSEKATYLVRFNATNALKLETTRAALDTPQPTLVSPRSCNAIDWTNPLLERQTYVFSATDNKDFASVTFEAPGGAAKDTADICFSRRRAYIRFDDGAFVEMVGAAKLSVKNLATGRIRKMMIPSYGLPRVVQ